MYSSSMKETEVKMLLSNAVVAALAKPIIKAEHAWCWEIKLVIQSMLRKR
jgi:hypothetical protein